MGVRFGRDCRTRRALGLSSQGVSAVNSAPPELATIRMQSPMTSIISQARQTLRSAAVTFGFFGLVASALAPATGCESTAEGPTCEGGYVTTAGSCEPKCDPAKCVEGNVCVENECRLQCASHAECFAGSQSCGSSKDDAGAAVQVCIDNGHHVPSTGLGVGKACPFGQSDCTTTVCPNGLECDAAACGGLPDTCVKDDDACAGKETCNIGRCPADENGKKAPCTVTTCAQAACATLTCNSTGDGDATAFCTQTDCASDEQCGAGFHCGFVRDPHDVCGKTCTGGKCESGAACSKDGDCQKGNSQFCGKTLEPCVDPKAKPAGTTYEEGPVCMMRKQCLRRDPCAPCEENIDCAGGGGDLCVMVGKSKACTHFCTTDVNCRPDEACTPAAGTCGATPTAWCTVAADCPEKDDTCVPRSVCIPRTGSCHAETATDSKFCYACTTDFDCGAVDSSWACSELSNGERACIDQSFPTTCTTDANCPKSPGGKAGACLDENDGLSPSDSVYHRCYFPAKLEKGQLVGYSCYP